MTNSYHFYFPYKDKDGQYKGLPLDTKITMGNLDEYTVKLDYNKIAQISSSTYKWLKLHPYLNSSLKFEITP